MKDDQRVSRALAVCRKLVSTFLPIVGLEDVTWPNKAQCELGLPEHSLVTHCLTQWGSMAKMVGRGLEQEKAVCKVLGDDRKTSHLIPTWQDINVLESVNGALGPLRDFTDTLSAENYVTLSALNPVLHILKSEVLVDKDEDTQLTKDMKNHIQSYLKNEYSDTDLCQYNIFL